MPQATAKPTTSRARRVGKPFFGLIEAVVVERPVEFEFDGSVLREHAQAAWTWLYRDVASDLIDPEADEDDPAIPKALDALMADVLPKMRDALAQSRGNIIADRRLKTQFGSEEALKRAPVVLNALKCRHLIDKAQTFGRATNGMTDEAQLSSALQSMPLNDPPVYALLMHAAMGQIATPAKLTTAVIKIAGSPMEQAISRAGFDPLIDAMLAHAQNQIHLLNQSGPFADIDLTCRAIDRYHRLIRAVKEFIELGRGSRWSAMIGGLTKTISDRIEPRVRDVVRDVNMALRRHREGADRLDSDQLLAALNGMYVLATVRDSRDSLALNAVFDQTWAQVGQALEIHIQRNLDMHRANPADRITGERLDAAIKMAELRFNLEYADVLRRAKETAERR